MAVNTGAKRAQSRIARQRRVRKKVRGSVFRSLRFTYAQLISDESNAVLGAASTRELGGDSKSTASVEGAKELGVKIAEIAKSNNIEQVVFDRNGYVYHGRVAAVADGAREGGLKV